MFKEDVKMKKMYNTQEYDGYIEAIRYFEELEEEVQNQDNKICDFTPIPIDKQIHRKRRENARKAKTRQLILATSVRRRRNSPYRWNPVWHKMKLCDISPQKFKNRFDDAFAKITIKEYEASIS